MHKESRVSKLPSVVEGRVSRGQRRLLACNRELFCVYKQHQTSHDLCPPSGCAALHYEWSTAPCGEIIDVSRGKHEREGPTLHREQHYTGNNTTQGTTLHREQHHTGNNTTQGTTLHREQHHTGNNTNRSQKMNVVHKQ
ncbi:hypothetical protein FHG87_021312 [Trinorchestia longiramus]|nr:hypothetical protein FHG87_021312 [Trinorchestia longiramus]